MLLCLMTGILVVRCIVVVPPLSLTYVGQGCQARLSTVRGELDPWRPSRETTRKSHPAPLNSGICSKELARSRANPRE